MELHRGQLTYGTWAFLDVAFFVMGTVGEAIKVTCFTLVTKVMVWAMGIFAMGTDAPSLFTCT